MTFVAIYTTVATLEGSTHDLGHSEPGITPLGVP